MTRRTYIYDKDLDAMIEVTRGSNRPDDNPNRHGLQIIRDIEPYRAIASDEASQGKRPVIGGRRQHREFLARNGYTEVGNEKPVAPYHGPSQREQQQDRVNDIKRAANWL